ncbi:hypothetical protein V6N13_039866 [Hibiscus sabdariffa]
MPILSRNNDRMEEMKIVIPLLSPLDLNFLLQETFLNLHQTLKLIISFILSGLHDLRFSIVANNTFPGVVVFSFSSLAVSSILCYRPFSLNRPLIF